jgi:hypothetical protein
VSDLSCKISSAATRFAISCGVLVYGCAAFRAWDVQWPLTATPFERGVAVALWAVPSAIAALCFAVQLMAEAAEDGRAAERAERERKLADEIARIHARARP